MKKSRLLVFALFSVMIGFGGVVFYGLSKVIEPEKPQNTEIAVTKSVANNELENPIAINKTSKLEAKESKIMMVEKLAIEFVDAIEKRDFTKIYSYTQENEVSEKEAIPEMYIADYEMLYKDDPNGRKSFLTIIKSGKIETKITPFEGNIYFVDFYPSQIGKYMSDEDYLRENHGKTFFSCSFKLLKKRLWLHDSFCYSETEGPYELQPDL